MVVAANDVSDLHERIVHDNGIVIRRPAIGAQENWIADNLASKIHFTVNDVVKSDRTLSHLQSNNSGLLFREPSLYGFRRQRSAGARIFPGLASGPGRLRLLLQFIFGTKTPIRASLCQQLARALSINRVAFRLAVGSAFTANIRTFIPVQAQPAKILINAFFIPPLRTFLIGVFNSHDERTARLTCKQPRKESRARISDVKQTGGTGSKSCSNHIRGLL